MTVLDSVFGRAPGVPLGARRAWQQLGREQVEQQPVPLDAVWVEPVLAHDPDRAGSRPSRSSGSPRSLSAAGSMISRWWPRSRHEVARHRPRRASVPRPAILERPSRGRGPSPRGRYSLVELLVELDQLRRPRAVREPSSRSVEPGRQLARRRYGLVDPVATSARTSGSPPIAGRAPTTCSSDERAQDDTISVQFHDRACNRRADYACRGDEEATRRAARRARARGEPRAGAGARPRRARARPRQAGHQVDEDAELEVERPPRFVSRGGEKLANALDALDVELAGRDCLDVGASTGGFTDCLLQRGAARVIARRRRLRPAPPEAARRSARHRARADERARAARAAVRARARARLRRLVHQRPDRAAAGAARSPRRAGRRSCS